MSCSRWFVLASEGELVLMWWREVDCGDAGSFAAEGWNSVHAGPAGDAGKGNRQSFGNCNFEEPQPQPQPQRAETRPSRYTNEFTTHQLQLTKHLQSHFHASPARPA
jgi:hypothetical protein